MILHVFSLSACLIVFACAVVGLARHRDRLTLATMIMSAALVAYAVVMMVEGKR
jgi:hypothetical protein